MGEMPPDLLQHIKETLKKCDDVFLEHRSLWAVFSDSRLSIWQERLPEASNVGQRIEGTIHYLHNKKNEQGTNALMLFFQVLRERYSAIDERHRLLLSIMNQFQSVSPSSYKKEVPDVLIEANPMQEPIYAVFETEHIRRCARSIALIEVTRHRKKKSEYPETGTGWLIAPGLVLTCWHVIATLAFVDEPPPTAPELQTQIQHMLLSFNHIEIAKGGIQYDVSKLEYSSSEINQQDFALLRLKDRSDKPYRQLDYLPIELDAPFTRQTQLLIMQHPLGQHQQYAWGRYVSESHIPGRILYTTPTDAGTSGAPVLNRHNWRVVALHNGENRQAYKREGTKIKCILGELQTKRPDIYHEIMEAQRAHDASPSSTHLTPSLDPYLDPIKNLFHASSAPTIATNQEDTSSNGKNTISLPKTDQHYEYIYSSTYPSSTTVLCVAFHPAEHYFISGDTTETMKAWDISSNHLRYTLPTYTGSTPALAFSSDGHRLASGGDDGTIILWNCETQKREKTLQGHTDWVSCLAFHPDGKLLASGSDDGSIKIWDMLSDMTSQQLIKEPAAISSLAFGAHHHVLASCAFGQNVKLWSIPRQNPISIPESFSGIHRLIFSPDGHYFGAASETGSIAIGDATNWKVIYQLNQHARPTRCLAFHPNGKLLASGGDDQVIQLWDVTTGKNIQTLVKHTKRIDCLAFSPDGHYLASGGRDAHIILWERVQSIS